MTLGDGERVRLAVEDRGPATAGAPAERPGTTGLGLQIVRRTVAAAGGTVTVTHADRRHPGGGAAAARSAVQAVVLVILGLGPVLVLVVVPGLRLGLGTVVVAGRLQARSGRRRDRPGSRHGGRGAQERAGRARRPSGPPGSRRCRAPAGCASGRAACAPRCAAAGRAAGGRRPPGGAPGRDGQRRHGGGTAVGRHRGQGARGGARQRGHDSQPTVAATVLGSAGTTARGGGWGWLHGSSFGQGTSLPGGALSAPRAEVKVSSRRPSGRVRA